MSAFNIARFNTSVLPLTASTTSSNGQLTYSSDFVVIKNAGTVPVALTSGNDNTAVAVFPSTPGTSVLSTTVILPGEVSVYRHTPLPSSTGIGGRWFAAITASGTANVYITPVEGR